MSGTEITPRKSGGLVMRPANMGEAMEMATMLSRSEMVPKSYRSRAEDVLVAMMLGSELGLNPIQSLQNIAVINGRPAVWGDALPALAQNHPAWGGMEESFDDSTMTATCTVWRKNGPRHTQTFGVADAKHAGLWDKAGPWKAYPKRMLQLRARGFALRNQFADALAGLITREEAADMPHEIDITPPVEPVITEEQAAEIDDMINRAGVDRDKFLGWLGVSSAEEIQADRYASAAVALRRRIDQNETHAAVHKAARDAIV
jgi:hypothetical protein